MGAKQQKTFTCFPKLPPEMQNAVWSWAAVIVPASSRHTFWVAHDDENEVCDDSCCQAQSRELRIAPDETFSVPSLLITCRDSRAKALPEYTRWGIADVNGPDKPIPGVAFIHKSFDTVYFRGMSEFYFLQLVDEVEEAIHRSFNEENEPEDITSDLAILRKLELQLHGIENIAMSWEQFYLSFLQPGNFLNFRHLPPSLKVFTIVYRLRDEDISDRDSALSPCLPFHRIQRGTVRSICAKKMLWWINQVFQHWSFAYPDHPSPEFLVRQLGSSNSEDTSVADLLFEKRLDRDYEKEQGARYGEMPEVRAIYLVLYLILTSL
jgi:hypothetical protein